ncbi:uncharacterized protein LOC144924457 [Branchiostoma floridae x Branchiostoma belcheri]
MESGDLEEAEQDFAEVLKLVHGKPTYLELEADCLHRLENVYKDRGKMTKDGGDFTKAAALYQASLVRTGNEDFKKKLHQFINTTEQSFLRQTVGVSCDWRTCEVGMRHRNELKTMRLDVKRELDDIDRLHDPYKYMYKEDDPEVRMLEAGRSKAIRNLFHRIAADRATFLKNFIDECVSIIGQPPCKYAFIGLGSHTTELVTPYSDLEFAVLVEEGKDSEETKTYFRNLTHYLHLKIISLGETILPAMGVKSLNDFYSPNPEASWFYDSITPRGMSFDGVMPWACKTPLGRQRTMSKEPLELIQTPRNMARFQHENVAVAEGYHLSNVLRNACLIAGDKALVDAYLGLVDRTLAQTGEHSTSSGDLIAEDMGKFKIGLSSSIMNVKQGIYRFPGIAIQNIALVLGISAMSVWDIIEAMERQHHVSRDTAHNLYVLVSISAELRLRTYLCNGGQRENMSALIAVDTETGGTSSVDTAISSVFHIPNQNMLFRYYYTAFPLREMTAKSSEHWRDILLTSAMLDSTPYIRGLIYANFCNYTMAENELEKALNYTRVHEPQKFLTVLSNLANVRCDSANHEEAIRSNEVVLSTWKEVKSLNISCPEWFEITGVLAIHNLGRLHTELSNYKEAIKFHEQEIVECRRICRQHADHQAIACALSLAGGTWLRLGDYRKAITYQEEALEMTKRVLVPKEHTVSPVIASLLNNLGYTWRKLGHRRKAIVLLEQALHMKKTIYGYDTAHPEIASSLENLGSVWGELGDLKKALSCYETALKLYRLAYGIETDHPHISTLLTSIGESWRCLGDYRKAITLHHQALSMHKRIYGSVKAHPDIARSLNCLGNALKQSGDYEKSLSIFEEALELNKTIHGQGASHEAIITSLNNLGCAWITLRDTSKAKQLLEEALNMCRDMYGSEPKHLQMASSLNNLGVTCNSLGDHAKALRLYQEAMTIYNSIRGPSTTHLTITHVLSTSGSTKPRRSGGHGEVHEIQILGTIHQYIATTALNQGNALLKLGDHQKAIRCIKESLRISRLVYGDNAAHPQKANCLFSLGEVCTKLGDYERAISFHEQGLQMYEQIHRHNTMHPDIKISLLKLGGLWVRVGNHRNVIKFLERAVTVERFMRGEDVDHQTITVHVCLGTAYLNLGDYKKAISWYSQALETMQQMHGQDSAHPDIAEVLTKLGYTWRSLGDFEKATTFHDRALKMSRTIYGNDHPDILTSIIFLAGSWRNLGDHRKALELYEEACQVSKNLHGHDAAHSDIADSLNNLGVVYGDLGDHNKARRYHQQALHMRRRLY